MCPVQVNVNDTCDYRNLENNTMNLKQMFLMSAAVFAFALAGTALAEQPATPMVSGDEPMEVGDSAQMKAPDPAAAAQEKTEEMLKAQSEMIGGDTNPVDEGDAAQLKAPDPAAAAQEKTEEMLKEEAGMIGGDTNPVDEGDAAELKAPK
jgi:hypothetical protein